MYDDGEDQDELEEPVVEEAGENVELTLSEFTGVDLVEDLHEDEGVEDDGEVLHLVLVSVPLFGSHVSSWEELGLVSVVKSEDVLSSEEEDAKDNSLVNTLSEDVSPHHLGDDGLGSAVWWVVKDSLIGCFGGKSEGSKGVHDQVDPEDLN